MMLQNPSQKYHAFPPIQLLDRTWPNQVIKAPPIWVTLVREHVALDEATERRMLGESLPPGLKLIA